jgi:hypothetical protein
MLEDKAARSEKMMANGSNKPKLANNSESKEIRFVKNL